MCIRDRQYIVAHGISTTINGKKAIIGSHHFVFEDEQCTIPTGMEERFAALPEEYSHLYLALEGQLAAVICLSLIHIFCLLLGALGIANMWMAIFADVGVMILAVLNAIRTLFVKNL